MALKVIKRGTLPEDEIFTGTCKHCSTEVEGKKSDGVYTNTQMDGKSVVFKCPVCAGQIYAYN